MNITMHVATIGRRTINKSTFVTALVCKTGDKNVVKMFSGEQDCRAYRCSLIAVVETLKQLKRPCNITVLSGNDYLCNYEHVSNWAESGWKTATGGHVFNQDAWEELVKAVKDGGHTLTVHTAKCRDDLQSHCQDMAYHLLVHDQLEAKYQMVNLNEREPESIVNNDAVTDLAPVTDVEMVGNMTVVPATVM